MIRCLITEWPYCSLAIPGSDHDVSTFPCNVFKNSRLLNFSKLYLKLYYYLHKILKILRLQTFVNAMNTTFFKGTLNAFQHQDIAVSNYSRRSFNKHNSSDFILFGERYERNRKNPVEVRHPFQRIPPTFGTFEAMIKDDKQASYSRNYPENTNCPYVGLRKPFTLTSVVEDTQEPKCRMKLQTPKDCQESLNYYGKPGEIKEARCDFSKASEMCRIVRLNNGDFDVKCDQSHCKSEPLQLGLLGNKTGVVDNWMIISNLRHLRQYLHDHTSSSKFGASFALLKCERRQIFQVLTLPKILGSSTKPRESKKINFNVIVEDSLSRNHLYRTLSKTVATMRSIIYNKSIPATVLEFEKVQSYDTTTKMNLQRLFSGKKYLRSQRDIIGIEDLFSLFKESGYSTLYQEDSCWYDTWGTLLDLTLRTNHVKDQKTRDKIWKEFVDLMQKTRRSDNIDDYGLTFLACSVYAYFRATNIFSGWKFPKVCFAGQHFSSFFLNYAKKYIVLNDKAVKPFFAYTHVVTSHERTGQRIVNDDTSLSNLLQQAAYMFNTVTIFMSDHGGKSTKFSSFTTRGQQEVFQPLIFMVIPYAVSAKLGPEIMNALVVNQKRLVGIEDLGIALQTYVKPSESELRGLFLPIPLNRTCEDLDLDSDALCLCEGMDKSVSNESHLIMWAAKFSVGSLNNMIQNQFIAGLKSGNSSETESNSYGYGACQPYTGLEIGLARHLVTRERQILAFTLFVRPFDRKTKEVFDIKISFPIDNQKNQMDFDKFTRASSFNEYELCADKTVNPKICTCRTGPQKAFKWREHFTKEAAKQPSFSFKPKGLVLDQPCLTIISRSRYYTIYSGRKQESTITYEAFNACSYVTYNLTIDIEKAKSSRVTRQLPHTLTIYPRTLTFLMAVMNEWRYGVLIPTFSFVKRTSSHTRS